MKLLIINGPNLNLIGTREPNIYGHSNYADFIHMIDEFAKTNRLTVETFQFNGEGEIIDKIHSAISNYDGLIINPGAYTHYSYAIHDAIKSVNIPAIEVHLSNIAAREEFRKNSVTAPACIGQISGLGFLGYIVAIRYFLEGRQ